MSLHSRSCSQCGTLASHRPLCSTPPQLNPWHVPVQAVPVSRRHRRRLQPSCAAVEQELDVMDGFVPRSLQRHGPLDQDLSDGMGVAIELTPRKRVNRQLKNAGSLLQLRILLETECLSFDSVNTSHALNLVAKMHRTLTQNLQRARLLTPESAARHRAEHVDPCLAVLDGLVRSHIDQFDAWDTSLSLWSYATLDHYDRQLFDLLCSRALQLTSSLKPIDCSNILVAFGRWGHYQPELLKSLPQALLDHIYDAKPQEVSTTLWGFARLRVPEAPGRAFLEAVCETLRPNLHAYGNQELTTVLWSLSKLHYYPGNAFLQQTESVMLRRLRAASAEAQATRTQHQYYERQHPQHQQYDQQGQQQEWQDEEPQQARSNGAEQGEPHHNGHQGLPHATAGGRGRRTADSRWLQPRPAPEPHAMQPQDVSVLFWSFGQMRYKAAAFLDELPLSLGAWLPQFSSNDLCSLLVGYANARHYHAGVLEVMAPLLAQRMHTLSLTELVSTIWSYGIFQHRPVSEPRFLAMLSAALLARLRAGGTTNGSGSGARPQTYALILKSCANLRVRPEALLQHVVHASAARLQDFRPDEMANLLYGLSYLASRAPSCDLPGVGNVNGAASQAAAAQRGQAAPAEVSVPAASGPRGLAPVQGLGLDGAAPEAGQHPVPEPEEMQLFYGVVRQCMRLLDEPNHPYGSRSFMHHQVLNSIIFSCLRIGYTPWSLIDFAESKGMRLTTPKPTTGPESTEGAGPTARQPGAAARSAHAAGGSQHQHSPGAVRARAAQELGVAGPPLAMSTSLGRARSGPTGPPPPEGWDSAGGRGQGAGGKEGRMRRRVGPGLARRTDGDRRTLFGLDQESMQGLAPDGQEQPLGTSHAGMQGEQPQTLASQDDAGVVEHEVVLRSMDGDPEGSEPGQVVIARSRKAPRVIQVTPVASPSWQDHEDGKG